MYMMRALGGTLYISGFLIMIYNVIKTVRSGKFEKNEAAEAPARVAIGGLRKGEYWHKVLERRPIQMLIAATIAILIGGIVEIFPMMLIDDNVPKIANVEPYTPLELEGRDLYIREGCLGCHSQMIRPFRSETVRYGEYSKSGEFIYDRPFLWGSKRTGPDLHRVGGKYPDSWHYNHMYAPGDISNGSIMPPYPWLIEDILDTSATEDKISVLKKLGTPYPENYPEKALEDLQKQAKEVADRLRADGIEDELLRATRDCRLDRLFATTWNRYQARTASW